MVITTGEYAYRRDDGVYVVPILVYLKINIASRFQEAHSQIATCIFSFISAIDLLPISLALAVPALIRSRTTSLCSS